MREREKSCVNFFFFYDIWDLKSKIKEQVPDAKSKTNIKYMLLIEVSILWRRLIWILSHTSAVLVGYESVLLDGLSKRDWWHKQGKNRFRTGPKSYSSNWKTHSSFKSVIYEERAEHIKINKYKKGTKIPSSSERNPASVPLEIRFNGLLFFFFFILYKSNTAQKIRPLMISRK